jgi:hypothetical protein
MIGERSFQRWTALDKTIDQGWADKDNLLITGSYAGYEKRIISHDNLSKLHVRT